MIAQLAAAALDYARRGWRVIPLHYVREYGEMPVCSCWKREECKATGKHPTIKNWREVATIDTDLITCWWRAWPLANIGLLMGGVARLVTIDIDGEAGRESVMQFEQLHGTLPVTLTQTTGRATGGEHLLFTVPESLDIDRIRNRAHLAPGIDIRAEGGLIVAAPSVHPTGTVYRWCSGTTPVAEMPAALFKLATSARERQKVVASTERPSEEDLERDGYPLAKRVALARDVLLREAEPAIQGRNGSTSCLRAACLLIRGYCLSPDTAFDLLWHCYNPICIPAWSENELMHKIESAEYSVSDEAYPWRFKIPAPDPSPAGRMVEAIRQQALSTPDLAASMWKASKETSPNPVQSYTNDKKRVSADDDEEEIECA
jgi:hypothetical protein